MRRHNSLNRRSISGLFYIVIVFILLLGAHPTLVKADISASATLNTTSFSVNEGAQLIITVNGTRSAELEIPDTDTSAFEIFQRGRSSQVKMINGNFSSAITFTCIIRGYKPGSYVIPPITISADNTTRTTEEIPFEVTGPSQNRGSGSGTAVSPPSSSRDANGETAFIRLTNIRPQSYIGEVIPVEVKAYFREGLRANLGSAPALVGDGLVMPQLHDQPVQTREIVDGTAYSVLTWQTAISNIKEGKHTVHLELDATLLIPQKRMSTSLFNQRSPFDDDFFDSVFGGYKQQPIKVASKNIVLNILPLPEEGKPADFTGAIGDFSFQVSASPQKAETGEPLTLTMTISGSGNFDRVEAPALPDSDGWKTYAPSATLKPQGNDHRGEKIFEQAIVAQNSSITAIPSLSFSYFDPKKGAYITRESPPIAVSISGKAPAAPAETAPAITSTNPQQQKKTEQAPQSVTIAGLAPQHLHAGSTVTAIIPLYKKPLFLIAMLICAGILVTLTGLRIARRRQEARPEEYRKRQRIKTLHSSLNDVQQALKAGDSTRFLAACRFVIQQQLGELWQCPPNAITRADLAKRLPNASALLELFTVAEQAAYSGIRLDSDAMNTYATTLQSELERLI